jgi:hypothetical protein
MGAQMTGTALELDSVEQWRMTFNRIFWGLFLIFDLWIGINGISFDVLPDVIGWLMIASALVLVSSGNPGVHTLRNLVLVTAAVSLGNILKFKDLGVLVSTLHVINKILTMLVLWKLCTMTMEFAGRMEDQFLLKKAGICRYVSLISGLLSIPTLLAPIQITRIHGTFGILIAFTAVIVFFGTWCYVVSLFYTAYNRCDVYMRMQLLARMPLEKRLDEGA